MYKIQLENGGQLDTQSKDLNIKLNRIVDDFHKPDARFTDFSYSFNLPRTKNNRKHFEFADVHGVSRPFANKEYRCRLYYKNEFLLDGIISLNGYDTENFRCVFYSKFTEVADSLKNLKLTQLTSFPTVEYEYEKSIANHITGFQRLADEIEFPLVFYKTPFMSGATDTNNSFMLNLRSTNFAIAEYHLAEYTNSVNSSVNYGKNNPRYYTSFPPATYIHYIVKYIFKEIGWSTTGFFDDDTVKKIITFYTGKPEDYNGAISTGSTKYINFNKTLPNVSCIDFLKAVVNAFNLYLIVDPVAKNVHFVTDNQLHGGNTGFVDITSRLDISTINIYKPDAETRIEFEDDGGNTDVSGFGRIFDYNAIRNGERNPTNCINSSNFVRTRILLGKIDTTYDPTAFESLWNKTTGEKSITLKLSPCNFLPYNLVNESNINGNTSTNAKYSRGFTVSIPLVSEQTKTDNKGYPFADDSDTNYAVGNSIGNATYDGGLKMAFYYGQFSYDFPFTGSTSYPYSSFAWIGIATGGTASSPTFARVKVPIASPYKLLSSTEFNAVIDLLPTLTDDEKRNETGAEIHGLLQTYFDIGTGATVTPFSLTLGENSVFPNLYSVFHKHKYDAYRDGYVLEADMICDAVTWNSLQIGVPIKYRDEFFRLVSIKSFDPVAGSAKITLLKKV